MIPADVLRYSNFAGVVAVIVFGLMGFLLLVGGKKPPKVVDRFLAVLGICFMILAVFTVAALVRLNLVPVDTFTNTTGF